MKTSKPFNEDRPIVFTILGNDHEYILMEHVSVAADMHGDIPQFVQISAVMGYPSTARALAL